MGCVACFNAVEHRYDEHWCTPALEVASYLRAMGAKALVPVGKGDDQTDMGANFDAWRLGLWRALLEQPPPPPLSLPALVAVASKQAAKAKAASGGGAGGCGCGENVGSEGQGEGGECCGGGSSSSGGGGCCGGGGGDGDDAYGSGALANGGKRKGPKVIKGVARPKKSKEVRRQLAAAKGSAEAAAFTHVPEGSGERKIAFLHVIECAALGYLCLFLCACSRSPFFFALALSFLSYPHHALALCLAFRRGGGSDQRATAA